MERTIVRPAETLTVNVSRACQFHTPREAFARTSKSVPSGIPASRLNT